MIKFSRGLILALCFNVFSFSTICYSQSESTFIRISKPMMFCDDSFLVNHVKNTFRMNFGGMLFENPVLQMDSCIIVKQDDLVTLIPNFSTESNIFRKNLYLLYPDRKDSFRFEIRSNPDIQFSVRGLEFNHAYTHHLNYVYGAAGCISPLSEIQVDSFEFRWWNKDTLMIQQKILGHNFDNFPDLVIKYNHNLAVGDALQLYKVWYRIDNIPFIYDGSKLAWVVDEQKHERLKSFKHP